MSFHTPTRRCWAAVALAGWALLMAGRVQAGLFDDDEARRAILDLRTRFSQSEEQRKQQVEQAQRSTLELNSQIEQLRAELTKLRGQQEQLQRDVSDMQAKQQGVDDRMRKLEPQQVTLDGKTFAADPDEKRAYDDAMALLRASDFDRASGVLSAFVKRYPSSGYNESARYWIGNALYAKRDYAGAQAVFRQFVTDSAGHALAPEAMLALANSQIELKDTKTARRTLEQLIKAFPNTEAAVAARDRLAGLR